MNLMDTDRRGFCAVRITESPHEWTWTQAEQEEMARAVMELDADRIATRVIVDAAIAWYEAQTHTPLSPRMKARTALCEAIKAHVQASP